MPIQNYNVLKLGLHKDEGTYLGLYWLLDETLFNIFDVGLLYNYVDEVQVPLKQYWIYYFYKYKCLHYY